MNENNKMKFENLRNKDIKSFVKLNDISKVYPNEVQAVYDFGLDIERHEFIVFVGPSGCGKSTTLRMIAGLEEITASEFYIDQIFANNLSPKDRDIAMVFQNYALYPHMTVYDNMAFSLNLRHYSKEEIDERVRKAATILELTELLARKPAQLSGGQRQRVALGRTIVRQANLFLMDEPLSNLDAKLRVQMRSEIIKLHDRLDATIIYVTHDQTEAMTMASRIVVMDKGHIQQIGTPIEIYNNPANKFVATFIGSPAMNLIPVKYDGNIMILPNGLNVTLNADQRNKIKEFFNLQIKELGKRLGNVEFEAELLPHKVAKAELKEGDDATSELDFGQDKAIKNHKIVAKAIQRGVNTHPFMSLLKKNNELETFEEVKHKLILEIESLIDQYQEQIKNPTSLTFGIRPEHIFLKKNMALVEKPSETFKLKVGISELLGSEYNIHSNLANEIEIIAKITSGVPISSHSDIEVNIDLNKFHLFDDISGKCIF